MAFSSIRRTTLSAVAVFLAPLPSAANVDLDFSPVTMMAVLGDVVEVRLIARSDNAAAECMQAVAMIIEWDATTLEFVEATQDDADFTWLTSGFLNDPDGINDDLLDGNIKFSALASPGGPFADVPPEGFVITTLRFRAAAVSPGTQIRYLPSLGQFGQTIVFGCDGPQQDVTGDISGTASVVIAGPTPAVSDYGIAAMWVAILLSGICVLARRQPGTESSH